MPNKRLENFRRGVSSRTLRRMNQRLSQDNAAPVRPLGGRT